VKAAQELYRVQFEGLSGAPNSQDDIINFSDEDDGNPFELKVGEESTTHQIKVIDLTFPDQPQLDHGLLNDAAVVTILDERTNETIKLTQGVLYSPTGNRYFILQFDDPFPSQEWKVTKVGDEQDFPGSTTGFNLPDPIKFVVDALDFDAPSVTVERQTKNKRHNDVPPIQQVLGLPDTSTPTPEVTQTSATTSPNRTSSRPTYIPVPAKPASSGSSGPATGLANKPAAAAARTTSLPIGSKPASASTTGK
jgi:hypothetical protein